MKFVYSGILKYGQGSFGCNRSKLSEAVEEIFVHSQQFSCNSELPTSLQQLLRGEILPQEEQETSSTKQGWKGTVFCWLPFSKRNRGSSSVCDGLEETEHHLLMSSACSRRHTSFLQGDPRLCLLQWCIITQERTDPCLTKLYPLNIRSAFWFWSPRELWGEESLPPFCLPSPFVLSSPFRHPPPPHTPPSSSLVANFPKGEGFTHRFPTFPVDPRDERCSVWWEPRNAGTMGGMRNEAQTDLAEISRPFWNDNEPLGLPPGKICRVSMMMKSFEKEKKKEEVNVYVCGYECVFMRVSVFLPKHHLGAIIDMKKVFTAVSFFSSLSLGAFSLIISKNRDAQNPNT